MPSKDNELDIEGLAVAGERVHVGLRGPVLRGWAIILQLRVTPAGPLTSGERLRLDPGRDQTLLDLGGLGVRELYVDGNDLLVLAGPTMVLDGPVRLLRWPGGATTDAGTLIHADELVIVHQLPHGDREDHAEGFTKLEAAGTTKLVIAYDSPPKTAKPRGKPVFWSTFPPGADSCPAARIDLTVP